MSTGPHPVDIAVLVAVFDRLPDGGATVIAIDHDLDLDLLAAADYVIDMGSMGAPAEVAANPGSVTGPYLAPHPAWRGP